MARLTEFGTIDRHARSRTIDDIANKEITVVDVEERQGNYGTYVAVTAVNPQGEDVSFNTGAFLVKDALLDAQKKKAFPLQARFFKRGRTWTFA